MSDLGALSAPFLPYVPLLLREQLGSEPEIEQTVRGWLARARADWPGIDVPPELFLRFVADRIAHGGLTEITSLFMSDLYIACASAEGDPRALGALEARYFPSIHAAIKRMRIQVPVEEVEQALRIRLFVAEAGGPPRIAQYNGKGDLEAWLRVSATRVAIRLARRRRPEAPSEEDRLADLAAREADPELQHLKTTLQPVFRAAFDTALAALSDRQRVILSQYYLDELSIDRIGVIHGVHRATAARWVVQTRAALLRGLRERVAGHLSLKVEEVDSLLRYLKSHLEITLSRLLRKASNE